MYSMYNIHVYFICIRVLTCICGGGSKSSWGGGLRVRGGGV